MAFRGWTRLSQVEGPREPANAPCSLQTRSIVNFEDLERFVEGAQTQVTQVERGQLKGNLTHLLIGDLPLDIGTFSLGVRSRGVASVDRITISMLTGCTGRVTHWSQEMKLGDVFVWPAGTEREARYHGGAAVAVISLARADLESMLGSEPRLREPDAWITNRYRPAICTGAVTVRSLRNLVAQLEAKGASLSVDAAEFRKRAIVEAMIAPIVENSSPDMDGPLPSALRIVTRVEEYLGAGESRPVHISEICSGLYVSRRTLHRAFHDVMGLGPSAFLRRKRLCSVHKTLRSSDPMMITVADVAMQHGFSNLGRFSGDYRSLFDEYPSQTLVARRSN
ncbi:MAG TPA: helix-turn-helix domain-containing protein [Pseudolabrys sp.]|jgi:AraC family ethanolamine operon transcriptional activator